MRDAAFPSRTACLLLHGFGSTPFEMAPVAERLAQAGVACLAPLLPGHGQTVDAWRRTGFEDWAGAAEAHLADLQTRFERVAVIGTGGSAMVTSPAYSGSAGAGASKS